MQEHLTTADILKVEYLEQIVKRPKPKKPSATMGTPKGRPLSVRYAEILKLRQAILRTQSEERSRPDRRPSE